MPSRVSDSAQQRRHIILSENDPLWAPLVRAIRHHRRMSPGPLLLRKGRFLTPRSRLRYRLARLTLPRREGFESVDEHTVVALILRLVTLPLLTLVDFAAWPVARRMLGRGSWWVVEVRFHGPDAEFVRLAEASTHGEAMAKLTEIADARDRRVDW